MVTEIRLQTGAETETTVARETIVGTGETTEEERQTGGETKTQRIAGAEAIL